jgi:hypothetical protein
MHVENLLELESIVLKLATKDLHNQEKVVTDSIN